MVAVDQWLDTGRTCRSLWSDSYSHSHTNTYANTNANTYARGW